jgi:hypothetical protein
MPCPRCGQPIAPGVAFCAACGHNLAGAPQVGAMPQMPTMVAQRTSGMAIAGFVLSFFCSLLGLIFSIMGRNECKRSNGAVGGAGLALAGIIISLAGMVLGVLYAIVFVLLVGRGYQEAKVEIENRAHAAEQARDEAVKQADAANSEAEAVAREVQDLANQIVDAQHAVENARNQADRDAASQRLALLQQQQAKAQARAAAAAEAAAHAARVKGVHVDPKCAENPLAPGCN